MRVHLGNSGYGVNRSPGPDGQSGLLLEEDADGTSFLLLEEGTS